MMITSILIDGVPLIANHEKRVFLDDSGQRVVLMDDKGLPVTTTPIALSEPLDYEVRT